MFDRFWDFNLDWQIYFCNEEVDLPFKDERIKPKKTFEFKVPKKGTGASGPPGRKSKTTTSPGKSGPPEGTRFSNVSKTKTTNTGSTGSASKKALSFRGF